MFSVIILQSVVTVLIGLLFCLLQGWQAAYSAWFGGLTALIPNVYFTYKAFQYFGARSIGVIVQSFWAGEMGKLILTAVLFAVLFLGVKPLYVLAVFVGYILVQMSFSNITSFDEKLSKALSGWGIYGTRLCWIYSAPLTKPYLR